MVDTLYSNAMKIVHASYSALNYNGRIEICRFAWKPLLRSFRYDKKYSESQMWMLPFVWCVIAVHMVIFNKDSAKRVHFSIPSRWYRWWNFWVYFFFVCFCVKYAFESNDAIATAMMRIIAHTLVKSKSSNKDGSNNFTKYLLHFSEMASNHTNVYELELEFETRGVTICRVINNSNDCVLSIKNKQPTTSIHVFLDIDIRFCKNFNII